MPRAYVELRASKRDPIPGSQVIGPVAPDTRIEVSIYIRPRRPARPTPQGAPLSRSTFTARHGAHPDDLAKIVAYAKDHGLDVLNSDAARRVVRLSGTAATLSKAFQTKLQRCRKGQVEYRGRTGPLLVGDDIVDVVSGVFGLDDRPQAQPRFRIAAAEATSYTPLQLGELYDFPTGTARSRRSASSSSVAAIPRTIWGNTSRLSE